MNYTQSQKSKSKENLENLLPIQEPVNQVNFKLLILYLKGTINEINSSQNRSKVEDSDRQKLQDSEFFFADRYDKKVKQELDIYFEVPIFLEFFFYQIVFFFLLGPFINLLSICSTRHSYLFFNMRFWGRSRRTAQQIVIFITIQSVFWALTLGPSLGLYGYEIFSFYILVIVRSAIIGFKYATYLPHQIEELKSKYVLHQELEKQNLIFWAKQSDESIVSEIARCLEDYNMDTALFYLTFFYPLEEQTKNTLNESFDKLKEILSKIRHPNSQSIHQHNNLDQQVNTVLGVSSFYEVVRVHSKQNKFHYSRIVILAFLLSLVRVLIGFYCRYVAGEDLFGKDAYQIVILLLLNTQLFQIQVINFNLFLIGMVDLQRKLYLQTQTSNIIKIYITLLLDYLISVQRNQDRFHKIPKILPTIDILDNQTIQAWTYFRRISLDYGFQFQLRYQATINMLFLLTIVQLLFFIANAFYSVELNDYITISNIYDLLASTLILIRVFLMIADVNSYFQIHQQSLLQTKERIDRINILKETYFKEGFESKNQVDREIIHKLKTNFKQVEEIGEHLVNTSNNLQLAMDCLNADKTIRNIRILGIEITNDKIRIYLIALLYIIPIAILQTLKIWGYIKIDKI